MYSVKKLFRGQSVENDGLNPFTYSTKYHASWNAIMAAYTFDRLSSDQKNDVLKMATVIESDVKGRPVSLIEFTASLNEAQRYYFYSLAMMNVGIRPAIGNELWFEVKNPHTDLLKASSVIESTRRQLEKEHNVEFPRIFND